MAYKANGKTRLEWAASMVGKMTIRGLIVKSFVVGERNTGAWFHRAGKDTSLRMARQIGVWHPWPKDCKEKTN